MAFKMASGRKGGKRRNGGTVSEINVTPLVDVMLVLLVIFMITAPMLTAGVTVDLPRAGAKAIHQSDNSPLEISIGADRRIFLGETELQVARMRGILQAIAQENVERRVYIKADSSLPYGIVMEVMAAVSSSGFTKIALITDPRNVVE